MAKTTVTLRNAGPNDDSAEDLYTDALGMLRTLSRECQHDPEGCSVEDMGRRIDEAVAILDGELQEV